MSSRQGRTLWAAPSPGLVCGSTGRQARSHANADAIGPSLGHRPHHEPRPGRGVPRPHRPIRLEKALAPLSPSMLRPPAPRQTPPTHCANTGGRRARSPASRSASKICSTWRGKSPPPGQKCWRAARQPRRMPPSCLAHAGRRIRADRAHQYDGICILRGRAQSALRHPHPALGTVPPAAYPGEAPQVPPVSIADGMAFAALGTDTGGSCRVRRRCAVWWAISRLHAGCPRPACCRSPPRSTPWGRWAIASPVARLWTQSLPASRLGRPTRGH